MIRLAAAGDTSQVQDLWSYCFDDTPEFIDFFFQSCYNPYNTLVVEEEGRIQSCLQLLPYRMVLRDREISVPYIVGVATWPEFRGRGLVRQLLQFADDILEEREMHLSILLPFQYDFYRKYGWEVCYDFLTYRGVEFSSLYTSKSLTGNKYIHRKFIRIDWNKDLNLLTACYNQYMKYYHGYLLRGKREWNKILRDVELDHGACYLYQEDGKPLGYILFSIQERKLTIIELVHLTPDAKYALLQLALSHKGQVKQIDRKAPFWDTEYLFMQDSRGKLEKETFVMGRIHNVTGALSGLPYSGDSLIIQVEDRFYNKNNDKFLIDQKYGVSFAVKTKQKPDMAMDIKTLSQLLWGYLPPEVAQAEGRVYFFNEKKMPYLKLLFPEKYNYMTEVY